MEREIVRTPDQIVAEQILIQLRAENLVPAAKLPALEIDLASGTIKAEAWALLAEIALDRSGTAEP